MGFLRTKQAKIAGRHIRMLTAWVITALTLFAYTPSQADDAKNILPNNNRGTNLNRNNQNLNNNDATTQPNASMDEELTSPNSLWPLPIDYKSGFMKPDKATLKKRILATETQPNFADPITLQIPKKNPANIFNQLGRADIIGNTENNSLPYDQNDALIKSITGRIKGKKLTLIPSDLKWLDLDKLSEIMKTRTSKAGFSLKQWRKAVANPETRSILVEHFQGDLDSFSALAEADNGSNNGIVPFSSTLPGTVRRLYGKYSHLRGRNCFGTALEFATPRSILNQTVNVELEPNHHLAMINSDEFMRALWLGYYELSTDEILTGLKWGDVVVFLDATPPLSWKSYRHAIVHLGGDVYFHKQSKSAASPIEITEWKSVVDVWARITPNLDYKVFRRLPLGDGNKAFQNPVQAIEKLSWTR